MAKRKSVFSKSVIASTKNEMSAEIIDSVVGDKTMQAEIRKVLQKANRRVQNLKNSGVTSPALADLSMARDISNYSVFSITGLDINDPSTWEMAKNEYGKALAFMSSPTSTSTGAKQYVRYYAEQFDTNFDTMNEQLNFKINEMILSGYSSNVQTSAQLRELYGDMEREEREQDKNAQAYGDALEAALQARLAMMNTLKGAMGMGNTLNTISTVFDIIRNL